jgi:hypothetical protein
MLDAPNARRVNSGVRPHHKNKGQKLSNTVSQRKRIWQLKAFTHGRSIKSLEPTAISAAFIRKNCRSRYDVRGGSIPALGGLTFGE